MRTSSHRATHFQIQGSVTAPPLSLHGRHSANRVRRPTLCWGRSEACGVAGAGCPSTAARRRPRLATAALSPRGARPGREVSLTRNRAQNHRLGRNAVYLPFCKHRWLLLNKCYPTLNARIRRAMLHVCNEIEDERQD